MWTEAERDIFTFTVAGEQRRADPGPMLRRYRRALARPELRADETFRLVEDDEAAAKATDDEMDAAGERLVRIAADTLALPTLADDPKGGLTEKELVAVFYQFIAFLADSKKKAASSPNCAPPAGASAGAPPTANTSACG